ncbi:MAG: HEPN domain-containing protein [Solirubrobacteraceae bacterium]
MSPRSMEFLEAAKRRLAAAPTALGDDPSAALSAAYYAMLYAARAALSEREVYAKTHRGTWHQFHRALVESGEFDAELARSAQQAQPAREQADYDAWLAPPEDARRAIELAETFVAAVEALLEPPGPR